MARILAILFGITVVVFMPMMAIFMFLELPYKNVAVSIYNLSIGLNNFVGPIIVNIVVLFLRLKGQLVSV